jgi:serine/threonine protein kinase
VVDAMDRRAAAALVTTVHYVPDRPWVWDLPRGEPIAPGRALLGRIGGGADFEVFIVEDARHGRCAAKLVRPHLVAEGLACGLVAREASALSAVRCAGVVRCLDVELHGPYPHLLLEYIEGPTLRETLRQRATLPPAEVATLGARLAGTLAEIADAGWLHLDVKPENIMLAGPARLLDFSISQPLPHAAAPDYLVGTPAYMAPEQRPGHAAPLGPPADVFALATTLVEALTGAVSVRLGVRAQPLPAPFEAVLGPALSPQPHRRPGARDLAAALAACG